MINRIILIMVTILLGSTALAANNERVEVGDIYNPDTGEIYNDSIQYSLKKVFEGLQDSTSGIPYIDDIINIDSKTIQNSCYLNIKAADQKANFSLSDRSSINVSLDLSKYKVIVDLDIFGDIDAFSEIRVRTGYKLNLGFYKKCFRSRAVEKDIRASTDMKFSARVEIDLNPAYEEIDGNLKIDFNPSVKNLNTSFHADNFKLSVVKILGVDVTDHILGMFNSYLINKVIEDLVLEKAVTEALEDFEDTFRRQVASIEKSYLIDLNNSTLSSIIAHQLESLDYVHEILITPEYIRENTDSLMFNLLMGDMDSVRNQLTSEAACLASESLMVEMPRVAPNSDDYIPATRSAYCEELYSSSFQVGNSDQWDGNGNLKELPWTTLDTMRLDMGAQSIAGNWQPYMKKVKYRTVEHFETTQKCYMIWGRWKRCIPQQVVVSECKLEMRIYKKDIAATRLKPLIAIHGGSWKYRGAAFLAMESQISHYTDQGFVVFAPFYRLTGSSDGNAECNSVTGEEIIADVEEAMSWVSQNKERFGATGKLNLVGYSAGAHLSAYLSVHHNEAFAKTLLMYPPLDVQDYLEEVRLTGDLSGEGVDALEGFLGESLLTVDINSEFVEMNSLPQIVQMNRANYPSFFMVHGMADKLVPATQSIRMCNALYGDILYGPAEEDGGNPDAGEYSKSYECDDNNSKLVLVAEGRHALDACIPGVMCLSGSDQSRKEISNIMATAQNWLAQ